jgi:hypothetical protein
MLPFTSVQFARRSTVTDCPAGALVLRFVHTGAVGGMFTVTVSIGLEAPGARPQFRAIDALVAPVANGAVALSEDMRAALGI